MLDMNSIIQELEVLSKEGHPQSIFAASNKRTIAEYEAEKAEHMAKATRSLEFVTFKNKGKPVAEADHLARISESYEKRKEIALKKRYEAEQAKGKHNSLLMRRDTLKAYLSAIQSQMKLT